MRWSAGWVVSAVVGLGSLARAEVPALFTFGSPPGYGYSWSEAISGNGRVVAGYSYDPPGHIGRSTGFVCGIDGADREDAILLRPRLQDSLFLALDESGDTVGGFGRDVTQELHPLIYHRGGQYELLSILPGYTEGRVNGLSSDGRAATGYCTTQTPGGDYLDGAFRWTPETGVQPIGQLNPWDTSTYARAISGDGRTIVGRSDSYLAFTSYAFKWTVDGGMTQLQPLNSQFQSGDDALGISPNGRYVVGYSVDEALHVKAVRWDEFGQILNLGALDPARGAVANDVSNSGEVVVGYEGAPGYDQAMIWTPQTGIVLLSDYLRSIGLDVPSELRMLRALDVSADGTRILGRASFGNQVVDFVAVIPTPASPLVFVLSFAVRRRRFVPAIS